MKAGKEEKEGARRRFERRLSLLAASRSDAAAYAFVVVVVVVRRKKKKAIGTRPLRASRWGASSAVQKSVRLTSACSSFPCGPRSPAAVGVSRFFEGGRKTREWNGISTSFVG